MLWGEYDRETQTFGLATPGGRITSTGVGGFTLGGGYGWLSTKYGLTCDNLVSADVVTADGRSLTASEDENEELFWGLRGGGGNFGVVTSFEFRLHPVGPMIFSGLLAFELDRAAEVLAHWRDLVRDDAPDELCTEAVLMTAPAEEFVPAYLHGKPAFALAVSWCGDLEAGADYIQPLRDLAPAVDLLGPMPYRALQAMFDAFAPPGWRSYWRGEHLSGLSDEAIATFVQHDTEGLSPVSVGCLFQHGGQVSRIPDDATAFSHRDAHIGWVRGLSEAMRPYTTGGIYLNFTAETTEDRVRAGCPAPNSPSNRLLLGL